MNIQLKWKQVGDDYELRCPCCNVCCIAKIYKENDKFEGFLRIGPEVEKHQGYGPPIITGSLQTVRRAVNKRVEELFNL